MEQYGCVNGNNRLFGGCRRFLVNAASGREDDQNKKDGRCVADDADILFYQLFSLACLWRAYLFLAGYCLQHYRIIDKRASIDSKIQVSLEREGWQCRHSNSDLLAARESTYRR